MDCRSLQEKVIDILEGQPTPFTDKEIRAHVAGCAACRAAIPEIERRWMAVNEAMMPPPDPARKEEMWQAILARVKAPSFPRFHLKLTEYRDRFVRMAAADPSLDGEIEPVVHCLAIEGEELDMVCHMKEKALVHIAIVDRKSRETSGRLDGCSLRLPSGATHVIREGGADIGLQDLIREIGLTIVRPDGTELRVVEP